MSVKSSIIKDFSEQYIAALKMTEDVIVKCKEELWQDYNHKEVISQLVYHILASADYSLCKTNKERDSFNRKYGESGFSFHDPNKNFSKNQLTDYLEEIKEKADNLFNNLTIEEFSEPIYDLDGTVTFYSLLVNNLRHIMNHVGAIHARLTILGNEPLDYVNRVYGDERDSWNEMNQQGVAYIMQGKLDEAEKIYQDICAKSEHPLYYYNLACVYSRKENTEKALDTLKFCLKTSNSWQHKFFKNLAKTDSDLTHIRELPDFQQLIER